jgi:hypothetical protein
MGRMEGRMGRMEGRMGRMDERDRGQTDERGKESKVKGASREREGK